MKNEDALRCTPTPMKSYYLWNPGRNSWSKQALSLHSILAQPGITDECLLADAATNQMLTVAQARACAGRKPKLTAPEHSLLKHCVQKPPANKEKPKAQVATPVAPPADAAQPKDPLPLEYKVLSLKEPCFGGRFDADALTYALNAHSRQGWHVHSCQMTSISSANGEWSEALLVILQRRCDRA